MSFGRAGRDDRSTPLKEADCGWLRPVFHGFLRVEDAPTLEFGGGKQQFLCLGGEDPSTGIPEASYVLDQPRTQLIVSAESDTVEHAYVVMLMFLTRAAIR